MKILIADNLAIVQDTVKQVVTSLSQVVQIDEVTDGQSALDKVNSGQYDLAILSDNTPGLGGLDVLQQREKKHGHTRVLIFSEYPQGQLALKAFKLGACGYLSRFSAFNVLNMALKHIVLGDDYNFS